MPRHWRYDLFIGGAWTSGEVSGVIEVIDPASDGRAGIGQGALGGYKQSGIGREWGRLGVEEFCEVKQLSWR